MFVKAISNKNFFPIIYMKMVLMPESMSVSLFICKYIHVHKSTCLFISNLGRCHNNSGNLDIKYLLSFLSAADLIYKYC